MPGVVYLTSRDIIFLWYICQHLAHLYGDMQITYAFFALNVGKRDVRDKVMANLRTYLHIALYKWTAAGIFRVMSGYQFGGILK